MSSVRYLKCSPCRSWPQAGSQPYALFSFYVIVFRMMLRFLTFCHFLIFLLWQRPKEQINKKKIKNTGRKRMMSKHSTELGSGMTGRTPILGAMATERTWVSLSTTRWDYRRRTSSPQRKAVHSSPPWVPASALPGRQKQLILLCVQ